MKHFSVLHILSLFSLLAAVGCANPVKLEYSIEVPPDVPREAKAQDKNCRVVSIQPRQTYAYWHMQGWIICLEGFTRNSIDLSNERPLLPPVQNWGYATRGQEEGYHRCRKLLLKQVKLHGSQSALARAEILLQSLKDIWGDQDSPHWKQEF